MGGVWVFLIINHLSCSSVREFTYDKGVMFNGVLFLAGQHVSPALMTYSSSSGSSGSNEFISGIKDLRRSSSQISLSSSIQSNVYANVWKVSLH